MACLEASLRSLGIAKIWPIGVAGGDTESLLEGLQHAAIKESGEWGVEEYGKSSGCLLKKQAVGEGLGSATAECEHDMCVAECTGQGGGLEATKVSFAVAFEELWDWGPSASFEVSVEIEKGPTELGTEA